MSFNNISFILHQPQLSENIGACARSIKNFNFKKLAVVNPKPIFPNDKILATSVGAKDIITNSKVHQSLESAIKKVDYVIATSARFRNKNIKHINLDDLVNIDFNKKRIDYAILLSWNYKKFFLSKAQYIKEGGKFIIPLPTPHIK